MTITQKIFLGLTLLLALFTLTTATPSSAPDVSKATPDMLETTPVHLKITRSIPSLPPSLPHN
ncbi:hypothetical protein L873DRAFT_1802556 [Choiromyces venosus 120613-1]|uniref:Uncharacterized protein n=1 Tax=Choiromyces venosus 120613-1 TaxID=1336337 RepID=A0A3N4JYJ9_9PEZI|nr:hypothetical protein L873DRAFT_1802556 [Choiromyces venosus 120613-1]